MEQNFENTMINTPDSRPNDGYYEFERQVAERAAFLINNVETPLFKTNADGLYESYLANIPEEARQHYTCFACNNFIERFGSLVFLDENGCQQSLMWDAESVPVFFRNAVKEMQNKVENAQIQGVFLTGEKTLGEPVTGIWTHLHMTLPQEMVVETRLKTAEQQMAEKKTEFLILMNALKKYPESIILEAIECCESDQAFRGDRVIGRLKAFYEVKKIFDAENNSALKRNLMWLQIAKVPVGYYHIASSPAGSLMDNLKSGLSYEQCIYKFSEMMGGYMVSTSAPTARFIIRKRATKQKYRRQPPIFLQ